MESLQHLTPPFRFGYVNPGLSRGAYPTLRNFRFLSRLQLKTIVSLTPEPPTEDLVAFSEMAGIKIIHLSIGRTYSLSDNVRSILMSALTVCMDAKNHPIYMHCLDGRRISSLVVLLLRRVQGWTPLSSFSEYWRYQVSCRQPIPTSEVEKVTKELELLTYELSEIQLPESMPKWLWCGDKNASVLGLQTKPPVTMSISSNTSNSNSSNNVSGIGSVSPVIPNITSTIAAPIAIEIDPL